MGRTIVLALVSGLVGGGFAATIAFIISEKRDESDDTLVTLVEQQASMERSFEAMQNLIDQIDVRPALSEMAGRLDGVERQMVPMDELQRLQNDVAQLEESYRSEVATLRGARAKAAAAALAVREMQTAVQDGKAFAAALNELDRIMQDDSVIQDLADKLRVHDDGVATLAMLARQLDTLRVAYLQSKDDGSGSWVNRTVDNLRALIDVEGVPQLQGAQDLLIDARDKTILDQLPAAIAELEPIVEEVGGLGEWIEQAQARQTAQDLVAAIDRHLDERVSRQG